MFNIVLFQPEIPHNAGAAGRLALATGSTLHLIKPLGFSIDAKQVKRAGLDYWEDVDLKVWESYEEFATATEGKRIWFLSTTAKKSPWDASFEAGDYLMFGRETAGLPEEIFDKNGAASLRIPMAPKSTRSLNLSTSVAIVLFEAVRQQSPDW